MKKRIATAFLLSLLILFGSCSVSALTPGYSDYRVMNSVRLDTIEGNTFELTSVDTSTFIKLDKKSLPENVAAVLFNAKKLDNSNTAYITMKSAAESLNLQKLSMFDFSLMDMDKNSKITALNQTIAVTTACEAGVNSVYYYDEASGRMEYIGGELSENKRFITFEIDHFSYFVLASAPVAEASAPVYYNSTGIDKSGIVTPLICIAVLALGCELLITLKRLFKVNT